ENPPSDTLLLLTLPKLERAQQSAKWFKAIDSLGAVIQVWPVEARQLPQWLERRMRQAGLQPTREAVQLLADRVEGNLLAARQEIEKLRLLHGEGPLDADQLRSAVADSARYDVFELVDSALRGETARGLHIIEGLRGEGTAAPVVLWALHREIAQLASIAVETAKGLSPDQAMQQAKVWDKRKPLVRQALSRLRPAQWLGLLDRCHEADRAIKGAAPDDPWQCLEEIVARMGGIAAG
ncbi:MAG: DNA polymerase III subunit delta, partial [Gammaproteobacteria bacterium]